MQDRFRLFLVAALAIVFTPIAPITLRADSYTLYTLVASEVSGSLNGVSFTDVPITFTTISDTFTSTLHPLEDEITPSSISFTIAGIGSGTLTASPFIISNTEAGAGTEVAIGEATGGTTLLGGTILDLSSEGGPILIPLGATGTFDGQLEVLPGPFSTSAGELILQPEEPNHFSGDGGYFTEAPDTPEPSSLLLFGSGLMALAVAIRRKLA